ncbi:MAG: methyltransferase [Ornithinimicrobium sp.]|uniref:class I SAM-dependent methyltransferase n=1 Tax=Ornithinimicrobium sp. TaxID=1977084 RepID=UPI0026E01A04|nr:methyltransferase [Ornithinimicrobium sp.]MDO5740117.1 methyltransferase [Ornithinimicrobium sp.]
MPASQDHYFTAQPASDGELRRRQALLAGRDVEILSAGGIFSPGHVDKGTAVLLKEAPAPPKTGTFLDLGCGWGPLALTMAMLSPAATVHAVDVNARALDLCRRNAQALGCTGVQVSTPEEVDPDTTFDLIWSNPPIRVGNAALHELMVTWLPRLAPGSPDLPDSAAYLVVQKNLGSDSLQSWLARTLPELMGKVEVNRYAISKGFRVLRVTRAAASSRPV